MKIYKNLIYHCLYLDFSEEEAPPHTPSQMGKLDVIAKKLVEGLHPFLIVCIHHFVLLLYIAIRARKVIIIKPCRLKILIRIMNQ